MTALGSYLEALVARTDVRARLATDPVAFVHRYTDPLDQEIAAVLAGTMAYGRVAAFRPVLDTLFGLADAHGGPRAWVEAFDPEVHGPEVLPLVYRWNRGIDWVLLLRSLRAAVERAGTVEGLLPGDRPLPDALDALVVSLREGVVAAHGDLPRGVRALLPRPADGSATKRWWMILRWMVRPADGVDLGLWRSRRPAELVVPLDTHVLRLSRFLGLTARKDGSLRTALEVTAGLRALDPEDPVRFDFALAHLGISGMCRGRRDAAICPGCPIEPVCRA